MEYSRKSSRQNRPYCWGAYRPNDPRFSGPLEYTDSTNLRGIALAPRGIDFKGMPSVEKLDFTSRVRTPEVGRFVVLQNYQGFYAILQILEVKDDTRGDDEDFLRFKYWILQDGSAYFAQLTFG